jgi:N-methylhydantoinase B
MDEGDVVEVATGGGGGYGDPLERDPEAVLHDVENGYISRESAKSDYGVVLTEESGDLSVDVAATNAQREDIRESRAPLSDLDRGISE